MNADGLEEEAALGPDHGTRRRPMKVYMMYRITSLALL